MAPSQPFFLFSFFLFFLSCSFSKFLGVAMGLIYLRLDYDQKNLQNFAGLIFGLVVNLSFTGLHNVIAVRTLYSISGPLKYLYDDII